MPAARDSKLSEAAGSIAPRLLALCAALGLWQLVSVAVGSDLLLAGPVQTLRILAELCITPAFWGSIAFSLVRVAVGILGAFALALALAPAARRFEPLGVFLELVVGAIKSVPVACMVVLLLIWFGSKNIGAVTTFLVAFPAFYFPMLEGLDRLDPDMEAYLRLSDVTGWRRICAFVWPSLLPMLSAAARSAIGMGWKAGVAAELIGMPAGSIGERVYQTKLLLMTGELFAWTIAIVILAAVTERILTGLLSWSSSFLQRLACRCVETDVQLERAACSIRLDGAQAPYSAEAGIAAFDLALGAGERVCLTGASGTGKSTLLGLASGLIEASSGSVSRDPADSKVSVLFQEPLLFEGLDAVDNVAVVAGRQRSRASIEALLCEILGSEELSRPVSELSGGQRRRVELARTMALPSAAIILDEPFAALDEDTLGLAAGFVDAHLEGRSLLVSSHRAGVSELLGARELKL